MIVGLLSIFGAYGLAIAFVHLWHAWRQGSMKQTLHYILITKNNGSHMEWYVRSLLWIAWLRARPIHIVIVDEGSQDDTLVIAARLAKSRSTYLELVECGDAGMPDHIIARYETEEVVLVRLSNERELYRMPLFQ